MATTTNYGWTTPDDTALVKDGAAAIRSLGTSIDTTTFNNASAAIAKTIVDAKGDIIAATAADTVSRLAVGANDTILTADSSTATGLKWAALPASGGMTLIQETVASSNTGIDFNSIPTTYKQLLLVWTGITHSTTGSVFSVKINNDTSGNHHNIHGQGSGGTWATDQNSGGTEINYGTFGENASGAGLNESVNGFALIDNASSTTKVKNFTFSYNYRLAASTRQIRIGNGFYNSTSAITSLNIVRNSGSATLSNLSNTSIRLYGIS